MQNVRRVTVYRFGDRLALSIYPADGTSYMNHENLRQLIMALEVVRDDIGARGFSGSKSGTTTIHCEPWSPESDDATAAIRAVRPPA
jgi:hypothetical protein